MARMIREYEAETGYAVGFKPAGGIRTAKSALEWLIMMKEELGDRWLAPALFRFGASGLLTDIERQLEHFVTGRYSAATDTRWCERGTQSRDLRVDGVRPGAGDASAGARVARDARAPRSGTSSAASG